jgi:hypothetical protein
MSRAQISQGLVGDVAGFQAGLQPGIIGSSSMRQACYAPWLSQACQFGHALLVLTAADVKPGRTKASAAVVDLSKRQRCMAGVRAHCRRLIIEGVTNLSSVVKKLWALAGRHGQRDQERSRHRRRHREKRDGPPSSSVSAASSSNFLPCTASWRLWALRYITWGQASWHE